MVIAVTPLHIAKVGDVQDLCVSGNLFGGGIKMQPYCSASLLFMVALLGCNGGIEQGKQAISQIEKEKQLSRQLPADIAVTGDRLACKSILYTSTSEPPRQLGSGKDAKSRTLIGEVSEGLDNIAIKIEKRRLLFTTAASVKVGFAEAAEFDIVRNTNNYLMAATVDDSALTIPFSTFTLNKDNGFAIYTKARPEGLFGSIPDVQTMFLSCQ